MPPTTPPPLLEVANRAELRAWLAENHATSRGVSLAIGKKGHDATTLTYDEAVEEALCFGWIDSTVHTLDEARYTVLYTPRKRGSTWSRSNKERVERLMAQGLMTPAGLAPIEAAQADGSWNLLDEIDAMVMPPDLVSALADAGATQRFEALTPGDRKIALYWIATAKRPETRARRIEATVAAALEGRGPT